MYLIAACLPRLRALFGHLRAVLGPPLSSIFTRRHRSEEDSPCSESPLPGSTSERRRLAPQINVRLTGQGHLETLAREAKTMSVV